MMKASTSHIGMASTRRSRSPLPPAVMALFLMAFCTLVLALPLEPPLCTTFNDNSLHGWGNGGTAVTVSLKSPGPSGAASDIYFHAEDESGASSIYASPEYRGDWTKFLPGGCGAFCYDTRIFIDGDNSHLELIPSMILISDPDGPGGAPPIRAVFRASFKITEDGGSSPGWHHICAPIAVLENGQLPSNADGSWMMLDNRPNSDWNVLLSNVTDVNFPVDFTSSPSEEVGYDNFCLQRDERCKTCLDTSGVDIVCATDARKGFFFTFRIKNLTSTPVQHLFLLDLPANVTATPNTLSFSDEPGGALAPGATSKPKTVRLSGSGATPNSTIKFRFSMHDADLVECCAAEQTIQLPDCRCAQILNGNVKCGFTLSGSPTFTYNFTLENLSPSPPPVEYVLVAPKPPATFTVGQSTQAISPPLGFGGDVIRHITLSGPGIAFGGKACLRISTHDKSLNECCAIDKCIDLPPNLFSCLDIEDPGPRSPFTPLGDATAFISEGGLEVEGLGTSGEDGIKFNFGRTEEFRVGWRPFEPTPPDGAFVRFGATGSVDGTPDRPLGELKIIDVGSALEITADYSDVGSTSQTLELYRDGALIQTITGHQGSAVARISTWPTSCGKGTVILDGHRTACYFPKWDEVIPINVVNGPLVMADGIRVLAEHPSEDLDFLQTFSLRAANIPSITVTNVESTTPRAADLDLVLNTGFDQATGTTLPLGTLPEGTRDPDWGVLGATVPIPAKLVINRRAAWPAPLADSQWISVNPNQGRSSASRKISFENCFCIGDGAATADLSLRLRADDDATVFLNGTQIGGPGGPYFGAPLAVDLTGVVGGSGPFRAGENCLRVDVDDRGGVVTGLDLTGSVKAAGGACVDN